jgi:hypothetical protein
MNIDKLFGNVIKQQHIDVEQKYINASTSQHIISLFVGPYSTVLSIIDCCHIRSKEYKYLFTYVKVINKRRVREILEVLC